MLKMMVFVDKELFVLSLVVITGVTILGESSVGVFQVPSLHTGLN